MNIDDIERDLSKGTPNLGKLLEAMVQLMIRNQATSECVMNTQINILGALETDDNFDPHIYHKVCLDEINKRGAELMAQFASDIL